MFGWIRLSRHLAPEYPQKFGVFKNKLPQIPILPDRRLPALIGIFDAVDTLAVDEILYYQGRRQRRRWLSVTLRSLGWTFATVGLIAPLLDKVLTGGSSATLSLSALGYVFLAGAGACFGANTLFGGTSGHIQFVSAQLQLEQIVTLNRLRWHSLVDRPSFDCSEENLNAAFALLQSYAEQFYGVITLETGAWGRDVEAALELYRSGMNLPISERVINGNTPKRTGSQHVRIKPIPRPTMTESVSKQNDDGFRVP